MGIGRFPSQSTRQSHCPESLGSLLLPKGRWEKICSFLERISLDIHTENTGGRDVVKVPALSSLSRGILVIS